MSRCRPSPGQGQKHTRALAAAALCAPLLFAGCSSLTFGDCESGYDPCVPNHPPDVDCDDVGRTVRVTGSDPHGLDADNDGFGCEAE